jgi:hypothetical protein
VFQPPFPDFQAILGRFSNGVVFAVDQSTPMWISVDWCDSHHGIPDYTGIVVVLDATIPLPSLVPPAKLLEILRVFGIA